MSAQVEVEMPRREDVLAVPSEAITTDDGQDVCFVVRGEDLERRPVKLGRVTVEMTEITHGLQEGEQVVLKPRPDELEDEEPSEPAPIASFDAPATGDSSPSDVAALR
jgi:multidrug efflux pump subunit AcrA (membrane-fusion protein)